MSYYARSGHEFWLPLRSKYIGHTWEISGPLIAEWLSLPGGKPVHMRCIKNASVAQLASIPTPIQMNSSTTQDMGLSCMRLYSLGYMTWVEK